MAPRIPTIEPAVAYAGDSWKWDKTLSLYPASEGWQLTYYLRGEVDKDFTWATEVNANGDVFEVRVEEAVTADLKPGAYTLTGRVTDLTDTYTAVICALNVRADPSVAVNQRSLARRMVDAIDAALEANAGAYNVVRVSVNGRTTEFASPDEARKARATWILEAALEEAPDVRPAHAAEFVDA